MDIDDILHSVDHDPLSSSSSYGGHTGQADLRALTRAWVAERCAPDLLPYPASGLIERVSSRIKQQIERVEELTGAMDASSNFALIVIQTELERWKFLVRSYVRARIAKIDKHTLHYLSLQEQDGRNAILSPSEEQYARAHSTLLQQHYTISFLSSFPPSLRKLDDTAGGIAMVDTPDTESAVFIRVLKDGAVVRGEGMERDEVVEGGVGEVMVARWEGVRGLVEGGEAELC
jgi:GINS complex subunit 4